MTFRKFALIFLISIITLFPSFNLHLTGDDYLGIWVHNHYVDGHMNSANSVKSWNKENLKWNHINYLLTDYGFSFSTPYWIDHFFGNKPQVNYFISYLLRLFAALSFSPLVKYL